MMIRNLFAAATLGVGAMTAATAGVDVGVSIEISQPGVYGRVDIGRFPQPQVIYAQPVIVTPPRVVVAQPRPVYMWVPPGHRKDWRKHCSAYGACGIPVVFVRDDWYASQVQPHAKPGHGKDKGRHGDDDNRGNGRGRDR